MIIQAPSLAESILNLFKGHSSRGVQRYLADLLAPRDITPETIDRYLRRAARLGALKNLDPFERAFLNALRTWLSKGLRIRSRLIIEITRMLIAKIEIHSLRGRAIAIGVLIALGKGVRDIVMRIEELLVIGLQIINAPAQYRIL